MKVEVRRAGDGTVFVFVYAFVFFLDLNTKGLEKKWLNERLVLIR